MYIDNRLRLVHYSENSVLRILSYPNYTVSQKTSHFSAVSNFIIPALILIPFGI